MGVQRTIYMDHSATTFVKPEVLEAMMPYFTEHFGNPSSFYGIARESKNAIDVAPVEISHGSLRLTLGDANTQRDVDIVFEVLPKVVTKLREMSPLYPKRGREGGCNV